MDIVTLSIVMWLSLLINAGISTCQSNFSCGPVCLLEELRCSCELTVAGGKRILTWELMDTNMEQVGKGASFVEGSHIPGTTDTFGGGYFTALLTSSTEMTFSSDATGTVNQSTAGYSLQCVDLVDDSTVVGDVVISIPDKPSQPENLTATTDTVAGSVLLSWTPPINSSQCVVGYIINTTLPNSTVIVSTNLNHSLFSVGEVLSFCTYAVSVAASDTAGRTGNWTQVLFSFNGSSPHMSSFISTITEFSLTYISNSTVDISWIILSDLPLECNDFIISTNASAPSSTTNSSVLITRPVEDPAGAIYTVSVAAMDKAGRTGEQSEALCFSFETLQMVELQPVSLCHSNITINWTLEEHLLQCSPLVTNYFITVINNISSTSSVINTNQTLFMLNDVRVGDVYVIEIVPRSAVGNGSAAKTTISIPDYCATPPPLMPAASDTPTSNTASSLPTSFILYGTVGCALAMAVVVLTVISMVIVSCIRKNKKKATAKNNGSTTENTYKDDGKMLENKEENPMYLEIVPRTLKREQHNEEQISEYALPQDVHHMRSSQEENKEVPIYQEVVDATGKSEQHVHRETRANSVQEKRRETLTLNRDMITDTVGYSDLPMRKGASIKRSSVKKMSSKDKTFQGNVAYPEADLHAN